METQTQDKLADFRGLVNTSDSKMSETAKAKLRAVTDRTRCNDSADRALAAKLNSSPITLEALVIVFANSFGGPSRSPRRRAIKALHALSRGAVLHRITDLVILGELLPGENELSMFKFLMAYPVPEDESVSHSATTQRKKRRPNKKRQARLAATRKTEAVGSQI
jgi:hypothetical protein